MKPSRLVRAYGLLLRLYPPALRREHGQEMLQCARTALGRRGRWEAARLIADVLSSVPREWIRACHSERYDPEMTFGGFSMNGMARDLAYALRLLWRSPGFTLAAVITLALVIGANAAIFSLADATVLRPLRVAKPEELYTIKRSSAYPDYLAYAHREDLFQGVIANSGGRVNAIVDGSAELVEARFVSGNYFGVLGVTPVVGRTIAPTDDQRSGPLVGVLAYDWWRSRFGGDMDVVGKTIRVNGSRVTIIGVAAEGFRGTSLSEATKVFMPLTMTPRVQTGFFARSDMLDMRGMVWLTVTARLKEGVTPPAAAAGLQAVHRQFHPPRSEGRPEIMDLVPLRTQALGGANERGVLRFVTLLISVVTLTLLIACANLANLLLSRAAARQREIAIRLAIGAGRGRVARQLLIESLALSIIGGVAGLFVAAAALRLLARFQLPGGIELEPLGLDLGTATLGYTAIVACATSVVFGLAPAWRAARTDVLGSLRDESRATSARSGPRSTLVAAQVALSLVLLTGTGLFLQSLVHSLRVPLGFRVDGVATASVNLGAARYDTARAKVFYDDAMERVGRLPGVTAAAWSTLVPTNGARVFDATIAGYQKRPDEDVFFYNAAVGPEYFQAAGTRVLRGRTFTKEDSPSAPLVAIVNETAMRRYWSGRDPLQGRVTVDANQWIQIVGVVEDTKIHDLDEEPAPYMYLPFAQESGGGPINPAHLFVRTDGDAEALIGPIGDQLRSLDRDAPVYHVTPFAWRVRQLVMPQRMGVTLFAVFSALALTLAAVGIYGVASYVTTLRTREIGIRIALGADRTHIRTLVLRQGTTPVATGLVVGVALAALGSRLVGTFLRGVTAHDPVTYTAVAALLALVAIVATWVPARRAARLEPMSALRES